MINLDRLRARKKEVDALFAAAEANGEAWPNVGEDYVILVEAACKLADWVERALPFLERALEADEELDNQGDAFLSTKESIDLQRLIAELGGK